MSLFPRILALNGFRTPCEFLNGLQFWLESTENSKPAAFLTCTPQGSDTFNQMTWAGKMGACSVIRCIAENKAWEEILDMFVSLLAVVFVKGLYQGVVKGLYQGFVLCL